MMDLLDGYNCQQKWRKFCELDQAVLLGFASTFDQAKRRDVHRALGKQGESPAWFNVRTGLLALLVLRSYEALRWSVYGDISVSSL